MFLAARLLPSLYALIVFFSSFLFWTGKGATSMQRNVGFDASSQLVLGD